MDKQELDAKVEEMAKALLSYCSARTSNHFDAEDLAQNIILEIYKASGSIRNADAVYMVLCGRLQAMFISSGAKTKREAKNVR